MPVREAGCPAGQGSLPLPVVIHVVADQGSVGGAGRTPGAVLGANELIPPEMVAELAKSAKLLPLSSFRDAEPEKGLHALSRASRCYASLGDG